MNKIKNIDKSYGYIYTFLYIYNINNFIHHFRHEF